MTYFMTDEPRLYCNDCDTRLRTSKIEKKLYCEKCNEYKGSGHQIEAESFK